MRRQFALVLVAILTAAAAERSISTSRQFVVYGADVRLRGAVCDLAEQTKRNLLSLLGQRDEWRIPFVINAELPQANFPEAPSAQLRLTQSEAGPKLQLDLTVSSDIQPANVEREVLRGLLLEIAYRDASALPAGAAYTQPPDWLVEGIVTREHNREAAAQALEPIISRGGAIKLDTFLKQRISTLDTASVELYRAYSAALLDLLLRGNDAPQHLARYIRDLRNASADPVADLVTHFPQLNGASGVANVWKQQLARVASTVTYRLLSVDETERGLDDILHIRIGDATYAVEDYERIVHANGSKRALQDLRERLLLFQSRANPVYREIVLEYQQIAALLARGSTKRAADRLARVDEYRRHVRTRMSAIGDYLNWFEATQQTTSSGLFDDVLKAGKTHSKPGPPRRDAISVYLDAIETQLE